MLHETIILKFGFSLIEDTNNWKKYTHPSDLVLLTKPFPKDKLKTYMSLTHDEFTVYNGAANNELLALIMKLNKYDQ